MIRTISAALFAVSILNAQAPAPEIDPAAQPDLQAFSTTVRTLRRTSAASDEVKARADKLLAEGGRRALANAYLLLNGKPWDEKQEFAWSLSLRPNAVVADSSLPFIAHLTQTYPASWKASGPMKLRLSVRSDCIRCDAATVSLAEYDIFARDFIEQPFGLDADFKAIPNGSYILSAELLQNAVPLFRAGTPIQVVKGISLENLVIENRLARIQNHDGAKATVRYPYVLAATVNAGRRQLSAADFGLPFQPQPVYDFTAGAKRSAEVLKALEAGKDSVYQAKGDQERHYWFEEAREMMAYHLYAPLKWDGKSKLPMVLVLHGNTRDQDYYFDRDDHILAKLAEQHGYLVVCPMGYRPNAGWGSGSLRPPGAGRGGFAPDPSRLKQGELSEKDALNVLDLVTKEYPVDPARIYLFGHSAGGGGSWYMGEKYADKWAAIAMSAAPTRPDGFPFDRLKGMPMLVCHGDKDDEVPVASSRNMVKAAKENGLDPQYLEVPGATHLTIVAIVEPKVFEFFDRHPRKNGTTGD
jgi:poly(3-hydroxybutyrate) depolymerase